MTIQVFQNEEQLKSASLVLVARLVFENAIPVIIGGNIADESEEVLSYLLTLAKENKIEKKAIDLIAFYSRQIMDENQEMLKYR